MSLISLLISTVLLASAVRGQSDVDCSVLNRIDDVQMFDMGALLFVVWQEPSNAVTCGFTNIEHTVTYKGFESKQTLTTSSYYAYFDYHPHNCVSSEVSIIAYTDTLTSEETSVDFYTETSVVEDLSVTEVDGKLTASWNEPEDSELCNFIYFVTYSDDSTTFTIETDELVAALDVEVKSCLSSTVQVTPVNGKYSGIPTSTTHDGGIASVRNYNLQSSDGEVLAIFDSPNDIESCEITYEVKEVQQDCYIKTVEVAATNGRVYSPWVRDVIEVEVNAVSNLVASVSGEYVQLSWIEPEDASACGITYKVDYNDQIYAATSNTIILPVPLLACVQSSIQVTPVSLSGKLGISSEVEFQGELRSVQDLDLQVGELDVVIASWNAPQNSSLCVLSYVLEYRNENGVHWYITEDTSYIFEYAICSSAATLKVTPHGEDGSAGPDTSVTLAATC